MRKDPLLEHPLLTDSEVESFLTEVRATQEGKIKTIVGSDFWSRAMAELQRRQIGVQTEIAKSLTRATWTLAVLTLVLAVATVCTAIFAH